MSMYLTVEEVKLYNIDRIADIDEQTLESLIKLYSGIIDEYCKTRFEPTETMFRADAEQKIMLPKRPAISVESVKYAEKLLCEGGEYFVYKEMNQVRLFNYEMYEQRRKSIEIKYTYGYEEIPNAVKKVLLDLIRLDREGVKSDSSVISETFENYSYRKSSRSTECMQKDILMLLDCFVQPEYMPINNEAGNVRARLI